MSRIVEFTSSSEDQIVERVLQRVHTEIERAQNPSQFDSMEVTGRLSPEAIKEASLAGMDDKTKSRGQIPAKTLLPWLLCVLLLILLLFFLVT